MGLFRKETTEETNNYKGMKKRQLIEIVNSQISTIDYLQKKLDTTTQELAQAKASGGAEQSEAQAEKVASLTKENDQLRGQTEALQRQLDELNAERQKEAAAASQNTAPDGRSAELEKEIAQLKKAAAESQQRANAEIAQLKNAAAESQQRANAEIAQLKKAAAESQQRANAKIAQLKKAAAESQQRANAEIAQLKNAAAESQQTAGESTAKPESIMEMSVHINKVMAAANKAADEYLVAIKRMYDEMNNRHSSYELEAQKKAEKIIQNANTKAENIVSDAKKESNEMWESLSGVFKKYCGEKQFSIPEE